MKLITAHFSVSLVNDVKIVLYRTAMPPYKMYCIGNMVAEINSENTGDLSTVLNGSLT